VIASGIAWSVIASAVHLAVFRGLLPSYDQLAFPLAIALLVIDLPLLVGLYVETALGRGSITFAEVIVVSILSGVLLALGLAALLLRARRAIG
jgi:hypothetical protein